MSAEGLASQKPLGSESEAPTAKPILYKYPYRNKYFRCDMIDNFPLRLSVWDNFSLHLEKQALPFTARTLSEMQKVLKEPCTMNVNPEKMQTYYMFRDVKRQEDEGIFRENEMRYDVTIIPAIDICGEFNKTLGHYHENFDEKMTFPELYEILEGNAAYLLQKRKGNENRKIERAFLVEAKEGDKLIIPPNYGHITVNSGSRALVMDNLVGEGFRSDYAPYEETKGGCCFVTKNGIEKNKNYSEVPEAEKISAEEFNSMASRKISEDLTQDRAYSLFLKKPSLFEWLKKPDKAGWNV